MFNAWLYIDHKRPGTYFYNGKHWTDGTLIFNCQAKNITDADKMFKQHTGLDIWKCPHIGLIPPLSGTGGKTDMPYWKKK